MERNGTGVAMESNGIVGIWKWERNGNRIEMDELEWEQNGKDWKLEMELDWKWK